MSSVKIQGSATGTANFTIAVPDGTSTDRTIELPDAAGSFVLADGSNNVAVTGDLTVDTSTLHVDSTNNRVGIGTASPTEPLDVSGNIRALGANSRVLFGPDGFEAGIKYSTSAALQIASRTGEIINFTNGNDGTEIARIDCGNGWFLLGDSSPGTGSNNCVGAFPGGFIITSRNTTGTAQHLVFRNPNGDVGSIACSGSSTAYNTSSDYRLKENVADLTGAIDRIKQVPVHRFNFIADPDKTVDGFLAHEVQAIVPEAIHGTKDEVDDDGNPVYQGIDQSKLVPLLTAALKDAITKIEALETRVAALEAV
jgi:hypothetical protein